MRDELPARRRIVGSDEGLRERELRKLAILHNASIQAFRGRGLAPLDAEIASRLAGTVYDTAIEIGLDQQRPFDQVIREVTTALTELTQSFGDAEPSKHE